MPTIEETATITMTKETLARWKHAVELIKELMAPLVKALREAWEAIARLVEVLRSAQHRDYPGISAGFAHRGVSTPRLQIPRLNYQPVVSTGFRLARQSLLNS